MGRVGRGSKGGNLNFIWLCFPRPIFNTHLKRKRKREGCMAWHGVWSGIVCMVIASGARRSMLGGGRDKRGGSSEGG